MQQNPNLSNEQRAVLFNKATEAPCSGAWLSHAADGMYTCANCDARLFEVPPSARSITANSMLP